jgi:hypothetical protein
MESWLRMQVRAFEHFGGIPPLAVPDNTKDWRDESLPLRAKS